MTTLFINEWRNEWKVFNIQVYAYTRTTYTAITLLHKYISIRWKDKCRRGLDLHIEKKKGSKKREGMYARIYSWLCNTICMHVPFQYFSNKYSASENQEMYIVKDK